MDEAINELRCLREDSDENKATIHKGNGEYSVVRGEDEMIQRLHDGWKLLKPLNHEKYLLQHS